MAIGDDILLLAGLGLCGYGIYRAISAGQESPATAAPGAPAATPPAPSAAPGESYSVPIYPPASAPIAGNSIANSVDAAGQAYIKGFEQFSATAYPDAGGHSIGWGHFIQPGEHLAQPMSLSTANQLFTRDLATKVEAPMRAGIHVPLTQDEFNAIADLVYNVGWHAIATSTLLRLLNARDYAGAAAQFPRWNHSGGVVTPALTARRAADRNLFLQGSAVA